MVIKNNEKLIYTDHDTVFPIQETVSVTQGSTDCNGSYINISNLFLNLLEN